MINPNVNDIGLDFDDAGNLGDTPTEENKADPENQKSVKKKASMEIQSKS